VKTHFDFEHVVMTIEEASEQDLYHLAEAFDYYRQMCECRRVALMRARHGRTADVKTWEGKAEQAAANAEKALSK
jgi:hypothetical protein